MNRRLSWFGPALLAVAGGCAAAGASPEPSADLRATAVRDDAAHAVRLFAGDREVAAFQYGPEWAIPHVWPLRSPSGADLLVQRAEPYPHHRSLWVVDRVRLAGGPDTDFYHEWKNLVDPEHPERGHHSFLRVDRVETRQKAPDRAGLRAELTWIARGDPVLDQVLEIEIRDLGDGEYLLGLYWTLRAGYGDVEFLSDWVHYGWPYLRMAPAFSGEQGGTILDDQGRRGQEGTNGRYASWVDYSNTVEGVTEGLTVFAPRDGRRRKWLTREYGTFGPRRPDPRSGTGFVLDRGESLDGAATVFVHRGDAAAARVAERAAELAPPG